MRLNVFLLILLAGAVAVNYGIRRDPSQPNDEWLPEMVHAVSYESFSRNPNFRDGKTLQTPPPGTIARGFSPFPYQANTDDALRAGLELKNPFRAQDAHAVERGALVFTTFCAICHGAGGKGDGSVTLRGYPPPTSLLADKAVHLLDGQVFHIITYGQKNMPGYASQVSREDRWKAVLHVRTLQQTVSSAIGTRNQETKLP
ncbi:MAG: cytochrome c [Acidobacteriia bacterium]|nr:cytochrome c [Terriglobia bacterium]